jgi:hypothetical protein
MGGEGCDHPSPIRLRGPRRSGRSSSGREKVHWTFSFSPSNPQGEGEDTKCHAKAAWRLPPAIR